jgi:hypothetical protein
MAVTQRDYSKEIVEAAKSVLIELTRLLGEYEDEIVLVGGWVPGLQYPDHIGSQDVDLAIDHRNMQESGYQKIEEILIKAGYRKDKENQNKYWRKVNGIDVALDLLAGEYAGTGKGHRHQRIQDITPRKARGVDLVFDNPKEIEISGKLPDGGLDTVKVRIAGIVPFIVMKSNAINTRLKEKDAYDVYFWLLKYPGGVDEVIREFEPFKNHGLVIEALEILSVKFQSPNHTGPVHVVNFLEIEDPDERERVQRDASERVNYLINNLSSRDTDPSTRK